MPYRILSLDGGGTWALIEVKALMKIYGDNATGHIVLKDFDLVAANSGGSIVAAALACNLPLAQILDDFKSEAWRQKIFVPLPWYEKLNPLRIALPMPKYAADAKLEGLRSALKTPAGNFGDTRLTDLPALWGGKPHLLITSFDYDRERAAFFRSNANSPARSGTGMIPATLAEAVHASSDAPIKYFDKPAAFAGHRFWDGAMAGLNNPILVALTEALAGFDPANRPQIQMRSLGTASVFRPLDGGDPPLVQEKQVSGYVNDLGKAAGCILDDPPDQATFMAYAILDGHFGGTQPVQTSTVVRLNPLIQPVKRPDGQWDVPGYEASPPPLSRDDFGKLVSLGIDPEQEDVGLIERFCDAWLNDQVPNQPIRANSDTLACEIGHRVFSLGKAVW